MNSDPAEKKLLERLQRQCARAEYCTGDIRRKAMKALDGDAEAAERVVEALVQDRFVDDRRYAGAFVREKSAIQGWGAVKIAHMLAAKGVDREVIMEAITEETDNEKADARLRKLLETKARALSGDPAIRLKLLKFGLSRGYHYEEVDPIVRALTQ